MTLALALLLAVSPAEPEAPRHYGDAGTNTLADQ